MSLRSALQVNEDLAQLTRLLTQYRRHIVLLDNREEYDVRGIEYDPGSKMVHISIGEKNENQ